jgi:aldose sugar dehydrogenase
MNPLRVASLSLVVAGVVGCAAPVPQYQGEPPGPIEPFDAGQEPRSTVVPVVTKEPLFTLPGGGVIWDLAFLPDGSALFTVRSGEVRKWTPGETSSTVVANRSSSGSPLAGLFAEGQSGLMGVAIDPAFTSNRRVYLYFSHDAAGTKDNRVVRYRLNESNALEERRDLVTGISYKASGTKDGGPGSHSGGRLRFGPDGFLYLTTGDNHNATVPQSPEALGSKVLRFTTEGAPAPGNPSLSSTNFVWALGFRNPQGLTFHPPSGAVFISEHGPGADDEVTRLTAGANGGWNPVSSSGQYNGYDGAKMTDATAVRSAVRPVWINADSQGMSACTFLQGRSWLVWQNRLAVGFLAGRRVTVLDLNPALDASLEEATLPRVSERVRSLVIGPDEKLYQTSDEGTIVRYSPRAP